MSIHYYKNRKTENYLALREQLYTDDCIELDDIDKMINHDYEEQLSTNPLFDDLDSIY